MCSIIWLHSVALHLMCRLKLIPRVVNVEEWVRSAPLASVEHKALTTYNDKPVLTRPQVCVFGSCKCYC